MRIFRRDGNRLQLVARYGPIPFGAVGEAVVALVPGTVNGRSVLEARTIHVADLQAEADEYPEGSALARQYGHRATLSVPLIREGVAIGSISLRRAEPEPFPAQGIALLQTFADQAVIAIENVRLFRELQEKNKALTEALDQQTATADILKVISSSPTDVRPVLDTIMRSISTLCGAPFCLAYRYDGEQLHLVAHDNATPVVLALLDARYPQAPSRETATGVSVIERRVVHIPDATGDDVPPASREFAQQQGWGSMLTVPLLRNGEPVGNIAVARVERQPFTEQQIALVQTFADQAVIAVENVRLFEALEARTQELTRSVGELRALSEVGQAISSTLDLQSVLNTIVTRATQLAETDGGVIYEYDTGREIFVPRATTHLATDIVDTMLSTPVRRGEGATGRLAEVREPVQLSDIRSAQGESRVRDALVRAGYRALLAVPLVREEQLLGGLTVIRKTTGAFAPETVELLQTFATQSSLAIQNARLFLEIEDKSRQLEAASRHKSEFLANMSHELRTPLNAIIGFSEVLSDRMFGELTAKQDEYLHDIYDSGQHLLSLINDILDLSKIEAGRMELELTDFDLPAAIDNALTLIRERAGRRGIALHQSVDPRLSQIRADERKVKQVLLNLLSNAVKFTPEGGRIDVRARLADGSIEIAVTDTGIGITAEDQDTVFEEFRQVGTSDKKAEGTGLGLALCRKFVELHGGRIRVESDPGHGSTFAFTLPLNRDDAAVSSP